jgi:hypothetical protein
VNRAIVSTTLIASDDTVTETRRARAWPGHVVVDLGDRDRGPAVSLYLPDANARALVEQILARLDDGEARS